MDSFLQSLLDHHHNVTRRFFLASGVALSTAGAIAPRGVRAADPAADNAPLDHAALRDLVGRLEYFTRPEAFGTVERGTPLPYTHPPEKLREVGMTRETWKLEIVPDPDSNAKVANPLSRERNTAIDWDRLMKMAETQAVRFPKIMTCNNGGSPLGMGLWEGVPLRNLVWLAEPQENVRRLFYYGYHNDDPKQMFRSSLPIGRVLEDPPGENPVIVCYKLNGEFLSGKRGGPVRMVVPEAYGFKSVKWLQRVVLTNAPFANDTYADGDNDVDSWMKTFARFIDHPKTIAPNQPWPITGMAQVGISGLTKVQVWLQPADKPWAEDDKHFAKAPWQDAEVLGPPTQWKNLDGGKVPAGTAGFDPTTNSPQKWPLRYALAHWAAFVPGVPAGEYHLRCRTIDANGVAQPMPRPFPKSGRNSIQQVTVKVA